MSLTNFDNLGDIFVCSILGIFVIEVLSKTFHLATMFVNDDSFNVRFRLKID